MIYCLQINMNELLWVVLTSVILTLFFDTPFGNVKKLLFKSSARATAKVKECVDHGSVIETEDGDRECKTDEVKKEL